MAFRSSDQFWDPRARTDHLKWIELGLQGTPVCLHKEKLGCWRWHGANVPNQDPELCAMQYKELRKGFQALAMRHPAFANKIGVKKLLKQFARCHLMGGFYAGLSQSWSLARKEFRRAYDFDNSVLSIAAICSTWPGFYVLSHPLYRLAEWVKVKVKR